MKTKLKHSDEILSLSSGSCLIATSKVSGVNMRAGGRIDYEPGARFRLNSSLGDLIWCLDDGARSVSFDREDMFALEPTTKYDQ